MGSATYRATSGALHADAYYRNEWGVLNDAKNCASNATERDGFHKNVFTTVLLTPSIVEASGTMTGTFANRANPRTNSALRDKSNPVPAGSSDDFGFHLFVSDSVSDYFDSLGGKPWETPINLTLYFGVGTELVRHGIRSFFRDQKGMQAILQTGGIEKPRFGVSIDDAQIRALLSRMFAGTSVPYRIKVIAAFSTGSCGLNQALLNDLVDVSQTERLVFYDCLYSQQCGDTAAAIKRMKGRASSRLKIVVYKVSEGGNSFPNKKDFSRLSVVADNPGLIDAEGIAANMFQNPSYIALVIFRALEAAIDDNVVQLGATNRTPFADLTAALASVPRGRMVSNKKVFSLVHGSVPSNVTLFADWAKTNGKALTAFYHEVRSVADTGSFRNLLWSNRVPGWPGGDGEDKHDLLIPEFGWEYLPY